jgi:trk system potassium uptake protein TrkH
MALYTSLYLIFFGALVILLFEYQNTKGLWQFSWIERVYGAFFTSVSARTAGFNTFDLSGLTDATLMLISGLMFIGASPGSTGGGIRTVTFTVIFLTIYNYIKGKRDVNFYYRRINNEQIHRTLVIFALSFTYITLVALFLSKLEKITFPQSLFETISAFSTVGLSVGNGGVLSLCANFTLLGKIIIMATMVIGKIGLLSFMMALVARTESKIRAPEARILI